MCKKNLCKNCVNLKNWVINGPLWAKYGGKVACQPPPAQNPGHAPDMHTIYVLLLYAHH